MMKYLPSRSLFCILFLSTCFLFSCIEREENSRPNIILIYTDDQGFGDIGYNGNPYIKTPVLDSLAETGLVLDNFYVAPVCTPSRASLLTGKYSIRTGVFDTFNGGAIMDPDQITLAEILQENGYETGIFGKWHLGDNYPARPQDQGFDHVFVHEGGGVGQPGDPDNFFAGIDSSYFDPIIQRNGVPVKTEGYCSDVFTDELVEFISDSNNENPFFAYLSFNAPHDPLQVPEQYYDLYADLGQQLQNESDPEFFGQELREGELEAAKRVYGMMTNIDDNIGKLISALERTGKMENTMIWFISDNGHQGRRYAAGLKGSKTTVYEGGIRVPALVNFGDFKNGIETTRLSHMDILPTLIEYLGIDFDVNSMDGFSFAPLLDDQEAPSEFQDRALYYHWHRGFPETNENIAISKGEYKFIYNAWGGNGGRELYNIQNDPNELNNLIAEKSALADSLELELTSWIEQSVIENTNLDYQPYIVGSEHQEIVRLNRNDARGIPFPWINDNNYFFHDVEVAKDGIYEVVLRTRTPLERNGRALIRFNQFQKTIPVEQGEQEITIQLFVSKGTYRFESVLYQNGIAPVFPFTITVQRIGD